MKKVKITVIKTTFDKELASEYGAEGLGPCPMLKEGQVFMPTMPSPKDYAMKPGKPFINMYLPLPMVQKMMFFITVTG